MYGCTCVNTDAVVLQRMALVEAALAGGRFAVCRVLGAVLVVPLSLPVCVLMAVDACIWS